jgi:hypothetical protein
MDYLMRVGGENLRCKANDIAGWVVQANVQRSFPKRRVENVVALGDSTPDLRGGFPYNLGKAQIG